MPFGQLKQQFGMAGDASHGDVYSCELYFSAVSKNRVLICVYLTM